jgi:ribose transport system permease protein
MTAITAPYQQQSRFRLQLSRHQGLIVAVLVFAVLFGAVNMLSPGGLGFFDISYMSVSGTMLSLAAIGETIVILTGGFDLSVGAVISLVNVVLATQMQPDPAVMPGVEMQILWGLAGLGIGAAVGAVNGFFVAVVRLQPIVVTISTMFIVEGLTLLVMDKPGGQMPPDFDSFFVGTAIPDILPAPLVVLAVVFVLWGILRRTRFGTALYAIGGDKEAARSAGVKVKTTEFFAYVLGGLLYGAAGVFISAQTASGDPLVGNSMLLQVFAAVVIGGTLLGGGRGGCVGSVFGSFSLLLVVNILLILSISAYFSTVAEGIVLILAVVNRCFHRGSKLVTTMEDLFRRWRVRAHRLAADAVAPLSQLPRVNVIRPGFLIRNRELIRYVLPAYVCFAIVLVVTQFVTHALGIPYLNSLLVLSSFMAILALGQGAVILTGGLDLSLPWTLALCAILFAAITQGSNEAVIWALPLVLVIGGLAGAINGLGVVYLEFPPIVITLAMNGILQGIALIYTNGYPSGFAPTSLRWLMTGGTSGITPAVPLLLLLVVGATLLLTLTPFGRRVYAVGNSVRVARLSGVNVERTVIGVYVLSGLCSALVGVMLTGFAGQASLGMGDQYLLPSVAVVVVGGTLITGGRGHYLGMLGGVLLLTALQVLLDGTTLPFAVRDILFGAVVLSAVVALRDSKS